MEKEDVRELWGNEFRVVPEGLSEEEVVSFVNGLMEKSRQGRQDKGQQASLLKLAEQTVVEADKLAESIKQQAREEAEEESAAHLAAAQEQAREQAQRLVKKIERGATEQSSAAVAKAEGEAGEIVADARREAQSIIQVAKEMVPGIVSEAKLEAEYIVRRFTVKFVEEIRSTVSETSNNMLPGLDELMKETGHGGVLEEGDEPQPAIVGQKKEKVSSKR